MKAKTNFKELLLKFLVESTLIVFSVLFALYINEKIDERKKRKLKVHAISTIRNEISENLKIIEGWQQKHQLVLENVNKYLEDESLAQQELFVGDKIVLENFRGNTLAGKLPSSTAWSVVQQSNVMDQFSFEEIYLLSSLYNIQHSGVEASLKVIIGIISSREIHRR
ncbi:MAG: hypothetical protein AAGI07_01650 [Bacteroidota bacterium]